MIWQRSNYLNIGTLLTPQRMRFGMRLPQQRDKKVNISNQRLPRCDWLGDDCNDDLDPNKWWRDQLICTTNLIPPDQQRPNLSVCRDMFSPWLAEGLQACGERPRSSSYSSCTNSAVHWGRYISNLNQHHPEHPTSVPHLTPCTPFGAPGHWLSGHCGGSFDASMHYGSVNVF